MTIDNDGLGLLGEQKYSTVNSALFNLFNRLSTPLRTTKTTALTTQHSALSTQHSEMEPPSDRIRLSQGAKEQLTKLKRQTKIDQWNILCRWALCRSLAESSIPSPVPIPADSNVEMSWRVFGGELSDILIVALKQRCQNDGLGTDKETLATQFRLHLHRGIGYLAGDQNLKRIEDLIALTPDLLLAKPSPKE